MGGVHYDQAEELDIRIRALQDKKSYLVETTRIKKPCFNVKPIPQNNFSEHKHLQEVRDKTYVGGDEINLLIGLDYAPLIPVKRLCVQKKILMVVRQLPYVSGLLPFWWLDRVTSTNSQEYTEH